jgi:hypothetical protein
MSALFAGLRLCQPPMHTNINEISQTIIGAAIEVHRTLGPGLLESAYEQCLSHKFSLRQIAVERQKPLHMTTKESLSIVGIGWTFLYLGWS